MDRLALTRPLAVLDLETTGTSRDRDRIVEIAVLRLHPDGGEEVHVAHVNPGRAIPRDAVRVHGAACGITDADVADAPPFGKYARGLCGFLDGCDLAGYNLIKFDLPLLESEFRRADVPFSRQGRALLDPMAIFHQRERRDLAAAVAFYCGREFDDAHSAEGDVRATWEVLQGQLRRYPDLPGDVDGLHAVCNPGSEHFIDAEGKFLWQDGEAVLGFGKHQGTPLSQLAAEKPDYLQWMLTGTFSDEVKGIARDALRGTFPRQPEPPLH